MLDHLSSWIRSIRTPLMVAFFGCCLEGGQLALAQHADQGPAQVLSAWPDWHKNFGEELTASDSWVFVGTQKGALHGNTFSRGAVRAYRRGKHGLEFVQDFRHPDACNVGNWLACFFPNAIACDDHTLFITSSSDNPGHGNSYRTQAFEVAAGRWVLIDEWVAAEDPPPGGETAFGVTAVVEGDWAFFGAPGKSLPGWTYSGAVYAYRRLPSGWQLHEIIYPDSGQLANSPLTFYFGAGLAVSGEHLAVGVGNGSTVSMYELVGGHWRLKQFLPDPNGPYSGAAYSRTLSLEGDVLVVGRSPTAFNGIHGRAYVYEFDGSAWQLTQQLTPLEPWSNMIGLTERFGRSVAIRQGRIFVGSPFEPHNNGDPLGVVHIYEKVAGSWTRTRRLVAELDLTWPWPAEPATGELGSSVAVSGPMVIGGAVHWSFLGSWLLSGFAGMQTGAAMIFTLNEGLSTCDPLSGATGNIAHLEVAPSEDGFLLAVRDAAPNRPGWFLGAAMLNWVTSGAPQACLSGPFVQQFAPVGADGVAMFELESLAPRWAPLMAGTRAVFQHLSLDAQGRPLRASNAVALEL